MSWRDYRNEKELDLINHNQKINYYNKSAKYNFGIIH